VQTQLLKDAKERIRSVSSDSLLKYFRQNGDFSVAGQTLQTEMEHFLLEGVGYLAYRKEGGKVFVLGDPVVNETELEKTLVTLVSKFPDSSFIQCSLKTASILKFLGYLITPFGVETELKLPYSLDGRLRADIRHLVNSARKAGLQVREFSEVNMISSQLDNTFAGLTNGAVRL
jgi:lysylphosphatidylglycerol synthetase-like protein (DUF2156 family)